MICPKCGFEGPDGPECSSCGVVIAKFARRGATAATVGHHPGLVTHARAQQPVKIRKPLGRGIVVASFLVAVGAGGAFAWEYTRLHMHGSKIRDIVTRALTPQRYARAMMTGEMVYTKIEEEARRDKVDLPKDRIWVKLEGESAPDGEWVHVEVKVLLPAKILGIIQKPVFRHVEVRFRSSFLPQGYARFETDPQSDIAREVAAREQR
jgi:hypothetical protein